MSDFFAVHRPALEGFSRMSRAVGARPDYVQGGGGNTSVKLEGGLMAIKASGFRLADVAPQGGYAVLDGEGLRDFYLDHEPEEFGDVEAAGAQQARDRILAVEGLDSLRPSVEAGFHSLLGTYVIHSHSVYANLAACCAQPETVTAAALEGAPWAWALIPYVDPGARLTFAVRDALARVGEREGRRPAVLLMRSHGLIVHADSAEECLALHGEANGRFQRYFGVNPEDYPRPEIAAGADGTFRCAAPWLSERLRGDAHPDEALLGQPMYPDQMVFFQGTLGSAALIDRGTGEVLCRTTEQAARALAETLCAVVFIRETLRPRGLAPVSRGESARAFIQGWESEKYRKSLAEGKV